MPSHPNQRPRRRGYLPHVDDPDRPVFVTIRLADALPVAVIDVWLRELAQEPRSHRRLVLGRRIERYLDEGHGECLLREPRFADCVVESLRHFEGERFDLHAWVVMPNHVHALLTAFARQTLGQIVGGWKRHTALEINRALGRQGRLWQVDHFDRFIRDEAHFKRVVAYLHNNPVKAGLCDSPEEWWWSSARERPMFRDCL